MSEIIWECFTKEMTFKPSLDFQRRKGEESVQRNTIYRKRRNQRDTKSEECPKSQRHLSKIRGQEFILSNALNPCFFLTKHWRITAPWTVLEAGVLGLSGFQASGSPWRTGGVFLLTLHNAISECSSVWRGGWMGFSFPEAPRSPGIL